MDYAIIKKLADEGLIDFQKMLLKHYKSIGLSEIEAFLLIELHEQKIAGDHFISPSKLMKKLTIPEEKLLQLLDGLIARKYVTIRLVKQEGKKETEDFSLDNTLIKLTDVYKNMIKHDVVRSDKTFDSPEEEIVSLLEEHFQKQLKPLEIELIQKWVHEDQYDLALIKRAILDALKANKSSISYVDGVLLKRSKNISQKQSKTYRGEKSEALKAFYDSWEQK